MKYIKRLLFAFGILFLVIGLFEDGITNFSDAVVLKLFGTLLLFESIEYKKNEGKNISFYSLLLSCIIAYLLAVYIFMLNLY